MPTGNGPLNMPVAAGSDALMSASDRGHINIVKALLAKGASVTTANCYVRCTEALHFSQKQSFTGVKTSLTVKASSFK